MADFTTEFVKTLGSQVSTQLAGTLGLKKQTAGQLIPSVLSLIMGGLLGGLLGGPQSRPPKGGR